MQQGRWVSYIYRYRNDVRCENAGFIKVQRITYRADKEVRIQIGLKLYKKKACRCRAYLLYDGNRGKLLTDIFFAAEERDTIMKRVEVPWDNPLHDGMSIEEYDGLLFLCDDGEALTGMWNEYPVVPSRVMLEEISEEEPESRMAVPETKLNVQREEVRETDMQMTLPETKPDVQREEVRETDMQMTLPETKPDVLREEARKTEAESDRQERMAESLENAPAAAEQREEAAKRENAEEAVSEPDGQEDICQMLLRTYPRLPLFADSQLIECVKIVPQDIGRLAMSNWKLAVNSFLSHGFYHYRYLMFGRVKLDESESFVIGVPGVFTNKEKYLANMFGFHMFIPVKKTTVLTGNFGYWISEVVSE